MMETTVPIAIAAAAAFLLAFGAVAHDRAARVRRRIAAAPALDPPLVHSINDDRCIGCEACVDVCPTEVLELVHHKARVVRFTDCVQCEQCANACPTTALVMYREGSTPRTLTVPELDEHFQTGVPNQYLIGEVAGKPLVKNAANLGRAVIEHIARTLQPQPASDLLDVVIVGSGPGGLSAGLTCQKTKLSCVVLEKEHVLASTVARYPKGKLFMAEPVDDRNVSYLPVFDATKEELVAAWQRVVEGVELPVKLGEAVESIQRADDGTFTIKTTVESYRSRTVVLATGLRGKPRLLAVPGANLEKVRSRLDDPDEFGDRDVLVVGGGDSAVEAAISLADAGARVTLSYRGDGFKRCKQANQSRLAEMVAKDALAVRLGSNVVSFDKDTVTIQLAGGDTPTIPNSDAFVLIGADTPVAWLETVGVRFIEREHLYALGSTEDVVRGIVEQVTECPRSADEALAVLRGHKPSRPARRLHSIVERVENEFRDVVTSVTGVFKIADIEREHRRRGDWSTTSVRALREKRFKTQPGAKTVAKPTPKPTRPARPVPPPRVRPLGGPNPFEPDDTAHVTRYAPRSGDRAGSTVERAGSTAGSTAGSMIARDGRAQAPGRAAIDRSPGPHLVVRGGTQAPPATARGSARVRPATVNPFEGDPTTTGAATVAQPIRAARKLEAEIDSALDNMFDTTTVEPGGSDAVGYWGDRARR